MQSDCLMDTGFPFGADEHVSELDRDGGFTVSEYPKCC
jgi:hypothetical protein